MQGVFVNYSRCKTKKALKEAVAHQSGDGATSHVDLEATSLFGNEYGGPLLTAPYGRYDIVGPNPYTDRRWYASIEHRAAGDKVT